MPFGVENLSNWHFSWTKTKVLAYLLYVLRFLGVWRPFNSGDKTCGTSLTRVLNQRSKMSTVLIELLDDFTSNRPRGPISSGLSFTAKCDTLLGLLRSSSVRAPAAQEKLNNPLSALVCSLSFKTLSGRKLILLRELEDDPADPTQSLQLGARASRPARHRWHQGGEFKCVSVQVFFFFGTWWLMFFEHVLNVCWCFLNMFWMFVDVFWTCSECMLMLVNFWT